MLIRVAEKDSEVAGPAEVDGQAEGDGEGDGGKEAEAEGTDRIWRVIVKFVYDELERASSPSRT